MELEGEVQGRQDQAQKIIDMPQRDQGTSILFHRCLVL